MFVSWVSGCRHTCSQSLALMGLARVRDTHRLPKSVAPSPTLRPVQLAFVVAAASTMSAVCFWYAPAGTSAYSKYMANMGGLDKVAQERGFSNRPEEEGSGALGLRG